MVISTNSPSHARQDKSLHGLGLVSAVGTGRLVVQDDLSACPRVRIHTFAHTKWKTAGSSYVDLPFWDGPGWPCLEFTPAHVVHRSGEFCFAWMSCNTQVTRGICI